jgi:hypothetical protein
MTIGCISSQTCKNCGIKLVCDSSGKAGTKQGNVRYILGPCCCALRTCPECNGNLFDFMPSTSLPHILFNEFGNTDIIW